MDINFIENMPSDDDSAEQRRARQQKIAEQHPEYTSEKHEADNLELAERFIHRNRTREAVIDEIADLL